MIKNNHRYIKTIVNGKEFLNDTGNKYRFVGQREYKGKPDKNIPAGATVTLQIIEDHSEPVIDKATGRVKDNNVLETFDATIVGATYPLSFNKGDYVVLEDFKEEISYYINFNLILRFGGIKLLKAVNMHNNGGGNNVAGQTK